MVQILHIISSGTPTWTARYVQRLVCHEGWQDIKHQICFLRSAGRLLNGDQLPGVSCWSARCYHPWMERLFHRACNRIAARVAQDNIRQVHLHGCEAFMLAGPLRRALGDAPVRVVASITHREMPALDSTWKRWLAKRNGQSVDQLIVYSRAALQQIITYLPELAQRSVVMPSPVLWERDSHDRQWGALPQRVRMYGLGISGKEARAALVLATHLLERGNTDFAIDLYSDLPLEDRRQLDAVACQNRLPVVFHNGMDGALDSLIRSDVVVSPWARPMHDGYVREAMSVGTPVVAFARTYDGEPIKNGRSGFLILRPSLQVMASAVGALLDDGLMAENMGREARDRIRQKYSLDHHILDMSQLYETGCRQTSDHRTKHGGKQGK